MPDIFYPIQLKLYSLNFCNRPRFFTNINVMLEIKHYRNSIPIYLYHQIVAVIFNI